MIFIWYSNRHGAVNEVRSIFPVPLLPASYMQLARPALFPGFFLCTFSLYFFSQILSCAHCTFFPVLFYLYFLGCTFFTVLFTQVPLVQEFFSQVPLVHVFFFLKYHWYTISPPSSTIGTRIFLLCSAKKRKTAPPKWGTKWRTAPATATCIFTMGSLYERGAIWVRKRWRRPLQRKVRAELQTTLTCWFEQERKKIEKMKNSTGHSYMYFYYGETGKRHPPLPNRMPVSVGGCIVDIWSGVKVKCVGFGIGALISSHECALVIAPHEIATES